MRAPNRRFAILVLTLPLLATSAVPPGPRAEAGSSAPAALAQGVTRGSVDLRPCDSPGGHESLLCGTYRVWENRESRTGRTVDLELVVAPARETPRRPDPIVFLAGGPGQAATDFVDFVADSPLRLRRDLVLVDQRGTGGSNALSCPDTGPLPPQRDLEGIFADLEAIIVCRRALETRADLRWYTTPVAVDDLDEVLDAMGYPEVNLVGGSYGTRAALVFLRRHGDRVRTAVLDGAAPTALKNPLYHSADAQRALDRAFEQCAAQPACAAAFPDLRVRFENLLTRLSGEPGRATVELPEGGSAEVVVDRDAFAEALRVLLYWMPEARSVPYLVQRAIDGDLDPFAQAGLMANRGLRQGLPLGVLLAATCTEDVARITEEEIVEVTRDTFLRDVRVRQQKAACDEWPAGVVPADYGDPVRSDVPVLVTSGELDPVTSPRWGEEAARHLSRGLHLVAPGAHGASGDPCLQGIVAEFIEEASTESLDVACVADIRLPDFQLPDPDRHAASATPGAATTPRPQPDRARELRERMLESLGGTAVAGGVEAVRASAAAEGPGGPFRVDVLSHRDGAVRIEWSGGPAMGIAPDHGSRWMAVDGETVPLDVQTETFVRGHELHMLVLAPETRLSGLAYTGRTTFAGERALRLTGLDALEGPVDLYFREEDLLPLGMRLQDQVRPGRAPVVVTFEDWRPAGGLQLFHAARFEQGNEVFHYRYETLEVLATVDPSAFEPPGPPQR